jgi:hypothetical protein
MTRLVLHAGTHATGWLVTQRQLVSWRASLDGAGVRLHPGDNADTWLSHTHNLARASVPAAVATAAESAVRDQARMLMLSSEKLEDALRDAGQLANLAAFAVRYEMPLTIVVVVRDQLGCLNELYCERVVRLQMARAFSVFADDPSPSERFDYSTAFRRVIEHPDIDLVAVPYRELRPGAEARAVLTAAGLDADEAAALPAEESPRRLPGPYHVAAARLLFKRLWRLGISAKAPRSQITEAAAELERHALAAGWDTVPYWGWDPTSRAAAVARYHAGNDALAQAVWGRDWGDDWEHHDHTETDLASSDPALVVDILTSVDALVKKLQPPGEPVDHA